MTAAPFDPLHPMMEAFCESDVSSSTAQELRRAATTCEETLAAYLQNAVGRSPFAAAILLAVGALEAAATAADESDDERRELSFLIGATLCRDALETVRAHGLDEQLLRCAAALDRAATICDRAPRRS